MGIASLVRSAPYRSDSTPPSSRRDAPSSAREEAFPESEPPTAQVHVELSKTFGGRRAESTCMREVFTRLERLAPTEMAIMLVGETGTGKSSFARALHGASARSAGPFARVDCAAVDRDAVTAELFGSGAAGTRGAEAALERASGGTLFLEAVGELPSAAQALLLEALEKRSLVRNGVERELDLRIISATTQDLRARVSDGHFREDLYFRLTAAVVALPPLRARLEDLALIVPELLDELGHGSVGVAESALAVLARQSWPGNVRQLQNAIGSALSLVDGGVLKAEHLRQCVVEAAKLELDCLPLGGLPLADIERAAIKQTLELTRGMKAPAAQALGIAVSTLYDKVKKYGL